MKGSARRGARAGAIFFFFEKAESCFFFGDEKAARRLRERGFPYGKRVSSKNIACSEENKLFMRHVYRSFFSFLIKSASDGI